MHNRISQFRGSRGTTSLSTPTIALQGRAGAPPPPSANATGPLPTVFISVPPSCPCSPHLYKELCSGMLMLLFQEVRKNTFLVWRHCVAKVLLVFR